MRIITIMQDKIIKKKAAFKSFESIIKFRYFGMTGTNKNYINKEVKSRRNT